MKAALLTGIRQIEIRDVPEPNLEDPGDVLLAVEAIGVCGSDMHYYRTGRIGDQVVEFPFLIGHECCGRVLAVGDDVSRVKVGQRVAVDPLIWCGRCDQCLAGREHTCRNQKFLGCPGQVEGCLAERLIMPAASCYPVPDPMDAETVALIEPMTIGLYASRLAGEVAGKRVGILGAGPIGLSVLLACRLAGAAETLVTEIRDYRAAMAAELGADWTGNAEKTNVAKEILARRPDGLDVVFECAGEQSAIDDALALVKPGGTIMMVGIPPEDRISFEISRLRRREVTVQPVRRQNRCVADTIDLVAAGRLNGGPMITHRYTLDQTAEAFATVADYKDNVVKAMVAVE